MVTIIAVIINHHVWTKYTISSSVGIFIKLTLCYKYCILYGKINSDNANYHAIIMMPKVNAPIHSCKKATHPLPIHKSSKPRSLKHFSMTNRESYDYLDNILRLSFNLLQSLERLETETAIYFNKMESLENNNLKNIKKLKKNLAVQPNHEKIFLSRFEHNLWNKHVEHLEHLDQQMGAGHSLLGNKDVKIMKKCTIILIGCMTLALKVLAMFTLSKKITVA